MSGPLDLPHQVDHPGIRGQAYGELLEVQLSVAQEVIRFSGVLQGEKLLEDRPSWDDEGPAQWTAPQLPQSSWKQFKRLDDRAKQLFYACLAQ